MSITMTKMSEKIAAEKGANSEVLTFSFGKIEAGLVLAAMSERGLCFVALGGNRDRLRRELRDRFPAADLAEDENDSQGAAGAIADLIDGRHNDCNLSLDLGGTEFQRKVWGELLKIPRGQTMTYSELAVRVGAPKAVRAVGTACGANRIAVVVPCHRVVGSDRKLHGYRWGLDWKRALLEKEKASQIAVTK